MLLQTEMDAQWLPTDLKNSSKNIPSWDSLVCFLFHGDGENNVFVSKMCPGEIVQNVPRRRRTLNTLRNACGADPWQGTHSTILVMSGCRK